MLLLSRVLRTAAVLLLLSALGAAQQLDSALFHEMQWRLVGPFRGGRALTATGVRGKPGLFYFGSVGGGVWKSSDAGNTWNPIFDSQPIASIGAMAVAPSDPNIIYVGSGEADMRSDISYGNGMYKSTDAGQTWTHIGLEDTQQIGQVIVDPSNANIVFVAALGHPYAANSQRGLYRSGDGGQTWQRVLYVNDDTGAIDVTMDPRDSRVLYAAMWQTRRPPWNVYPPSNGPGSGVYKSIDGGTTWQKLAGGLPTEGLGRVGLAVAPAAPRRVYAIVDAKQGGIYRSDDAGQTWKLMDSEDRIWGRGWYFGVVAVDPKNPDVVYVANTAMYKSVDGGATFTAFKGAPGGDDYHSIWIDPDDSARMIVSSDQGTIVTLNGGATWSSWYNQPTAQLYHISADNRTPYWLYASQQDSGAIAVPSRSDYASITARDIRPLAVGGESDMVVPDPVNTSILYGGRVDRFDWRTYQLQNISPTIGRAEHMRDVWTLPIAISAADPKKIYFSHQIVFRSTDNGHSWQQISPDLTREAPAVPQNLDEITAKYGLESPRKGVVYSLGPSPLNANLLWAGTDDGLIHVTHDDGKTWQNVTPAELTPWSKVGIIEASHFDQSVAYAAVDRHRLDDRRAYIYRTRDGGKSWQVLGKGIRDGAFVNAVREDPVRRGLLFAGTELGVYVSFDDGDTWQPLQMNLPVTSIRDLAIHGNDLAVATHGRSFWILDDISPLRELTADALRNDVHLFKPAVAARIRPGSDQGTPNPPSDVAHGDNPPSGAIIDYFLKSDSSTPVTLEIVDAGGKVLRKFASDERTPPVEEKSLQYTVGWVKQPKPLAATAGLHRFIAELRTTSPVPASGWRGGGAVWFAPGKYTVRLTANGKTSTQPLTIVADPRVTASAADLQQQFAVSMRARDALARVAAAVAKAGAIEKQLQAAEARATGANLTTLQQFHSRFSAVVGPPPAGYGSPSSKVQTDFTSLRYLSGDLRAVLGALQSADAAPTVEQVNAANADGQKVDRALAQWEQLLKNELPKLNDALRATGTQISAAAVAQPIASDDEDRDSR